MIQFVTDSSLRIVKGDIRDAEELSDAMAGANCVVHLAAISDLRYSMRHPTVCRSVNVRGTQRVVDACISNAVTKLLFASSSSVYGDVSTLPLTEESPLVPASVYGETKLAGEKACKAAPAGLEVSIFRLFNVYGWPRSLAGGSAIDEFVTRVLDGLPPKIHGDGEQRRDFVHIDDVVQAFMRSLKVASQGVFNIGYGESVSINSLAATILAIAGRDDLVPVHDRGVAGEVTRSQADISLARRRLKYEPRVTLSEGLRRLMK